MKTQVEQTKSADLAELVGQRVTAEFLVDSVYFATEGVLEKRSEFEAVNERDFFIDSKSGPMAIASNEGRKTQTRRIMNPQPTPISFGWHWMNNKKAGCGWGELVSPPESISNLCPYGQPSDRLWVREEHYQFGHWEPVPGVKTKTGRMKLKFVADTNEVLFEAPESFRVGRNHYDPSKPAWHKRLARFMPRKFSRTTLEITKVRVERLLDISEEDAKAEGVQPCDVLGVESGYVDYMCPIGGVSCAKISFQSLWESINGRDSWEQNPWVWVIEFKKI